jgi:membrane protease YdiL (CAAX protease family)
VALGIIAAGIAYAFGAGDDVAGAFAITFGSAGILAFALLVMRRRPRHLWRMAFHSRRGLGPAIGVGLLAGVACLISAGVVFAIAEAVDPSAVDTLEEAQQDLQDAELGPTWSLGLVVVSLAVLAPLGEELLFRVILLRGLVRRLPFGVAALVSATAFAAVHFDQYVPYPLWPRTLGLVAIGLILALVYRARGYWAAVTAHATVNGVAAFSLFAVD